MEEEEYNDIAIYIYKTKSIHRMQKLVMFDLQVTPQYAGVLRLFLRLYAIKKRVRYVIRADNKDI
jgi:hypothetical protein